MLKQIRYRVVTNQLLIASSLLYLAIPIAIFLLGWLRLPLALMALALLLLGTWLTVRDAGSDGQRGLFSPEFLFFVVLIACTWVLFSGIGGFGYQNSYDFASRNATFRDLINRPWPVRYDFSSSPALKPVFGGTGALVYYFAYWLPAAVLGKILGWEVANCALYAWTVIGVFLSVLLISRYVGKARVLIVLAFVFASGLDVVGTVLVTRMGLIGRSYVNGTFSMGALFGQLLTLLLNTTHLEWWADAWQYSSFTTQLFYVFNQSVPAWIVTLLLLNQRDTKSVLFTYVLLLYFGPLPALGLLPYVAYQIVKSNIHDFGEAGGVWAGVCRALARGVSVQNTAAAGILGFIILAFYSSQMSNTYTHGFIWQFLPLKVTSVLRYVAFCVLEFGIYAAFVFGQRKERPILLLTIAVLALFPLYQFGLNNDLVMRASIPALVVLFAILARSLAAAGGQPEFRRPRWIMAILALVFLVGAITPFHEFKRSWDWIMVTHGTPSYADEIGSWQYCEIGKEVCGQYVAGSPQKSLFFAFLARR